MSLFTASIILTGVFITSILSGILGMAGGMVLMGLLAWLLPVQQAMILHSISQFFANTSRAIIHRRHIHGTGLGYYGAGLAVTFGGFASLALVPDKFILFLILGIMPFLTFLLPKKLRLDFTKPAQAFLCGLTVTGLQLSAGVSGPVLDLFFQNRKLSRHAVVATKAASQSISHFAKFIYFGFLVSTLEAAIDGIAPWLFLFVPLAALSGTALSKHLLERISDHHFYKATQIALMLIGIVYLQKAASLWLQGGVN